MSKRCRLRRCIAPSLGVVSALPMQKAEADLRLGVRVLHRTGLAGKPNAMPSARLAATMAIGTSRIPVPPPVAPPVKGAAVLETERRQDERGRPDDLADRVAAVGCRSWRIASPMVVSMAPATVLKHCSSRSRLRLSKKLISKTVRPDSVTVEPEFLEATHRPGRP